MWLSFLVVCFALILSAPLFVVGFELFISLFHKQLKTSSHVDKVIQRTYKIVMPAHNEAEIIKNTLSALVEKGVIAKDIVVVADNCTDSTAQIAEKLGATVIERFDKEQRGKGYALDYGINHLKSDKPPEVLIIVDADCEIDINSLNLLVNSCCDSSSPMQALYLMRNKVGDSLKQRVAGFAWLVKNKIRPIAVHKLGLPVTLTGTGMAFPWQVISNIKVAHGNIVEDMQLGIDCTLDGFAPKFCEQAVVFSDFPEQTEAENTQRTRWEHGHLTIITQQVPGLIKQAIMRKDWRLLGLALDIAVPPLALLVMLTLVALFLLIVGGYYVNSYNGFFIVLTGFLFFTMMIIATWWQVGRDYLTFKEIASIPIYILSKLSIYVSFIFKRQKSWVRTARDNSE